MHVDNDEYDSYGDDRSQLMTDDSGAHIIANARCKRNLVLLYPTETSTKARRHTDLCVVGARADKSSALSRCSLLCFPFTMMTASRKSINVSFYIVIASQRLFSSHPLTSFVLKPHLELVVTFAPRGESDIIRKEFAL